jgi:hypothetical protein
MSHDPTYPDDASLKALIAELRAFAGSPKGLEGEDATLTKALAAGLASALTTLSTSLGECRQDTPYSAMRPVRTETGELKWCCNHDPEHC